MQDQITRELEQIIANRIGDVGRCEDDCICTYCCAQRALWIRMSELGERTPKGTYGNPINYAE